MRSRSATDEQDAKRKRVMSSPQRYNTPVPTKGRIQQSLAYWCLNATDWQWDIHRVCETARSLGCRSVELAPVEDWPTDP